METSICWICERKIPFEDAPFCPHCGPPEPWGPTPEEQLAVLKKFAEENDEECRTDG